MKLARLRERHVPRPGFSIIELLVVIFIILALLSLTAAAVARFMGVQQQSVSENRVRKIGSLLEDHYKAEAEKALREPIPREIPGPGLFYDPAAGAGLLWAEAGGDPRRARVIWVKLRLKQAFPMSYAEALNPAPLPPLRTYQQALTPPAGGPAGQPWDFQNSNCLVLALSQARKGKVLNADDLGGADAVADTNNDSKGLKELLDGWGKPIVFYRWPTGNPALLFPPPWPSGGTQTVDVDQSNPAPSGPQSKANPDGFHDPQDPEGTLMNPAWAPTAFQTWCHSLTADLGAGPVRYSYYTRPVVISAGRNKQLGLDTAPPLFFMQVINPSQANDNIYSYLLGKEG